MLRVRPFELDDWRSHDWELSIFPEYDERNDVLLAYVTTDTFDQWRRQSTMKGPLPDMIREAPAHWNVTFWEIMDVDASGRSTDSWVIARLRKPEDVIPFQHWLPRSMAASLNRPFMQKWRDELTQRLQKAEARRAYLLALEQRLAASG